MLNNLGYRRLWRDARPSADEVHLVLACLAAMKTTVSRAGQALRGHELAVLCAGPCAAANTFIRTVEAAGGRAALLSSPAWRQRETGIADAARLLGSMYDAVDCYNLAREVVDKIARHARVPVFDGLSHRSHPLRLVAVAMTILEWRRATHAAHAPRARVVIVGDPALPAYDVARSAAEAAGLQSQTSAGTPAARADADFLIELPTADRGVRLTASGGTALDQERLAGMLADNGCALVQGVLACTVI